MTDPSWTPPPNWLPTIAELDAAKRCSDAVNLAVAAMAGQVFGRWIAIRLSDGGSDGIIYDSKADAVRMQLHETQCAYVCVPPDGMTVRAALSYLRMNRQLYDAGMRLSDPDRSPVLDRRQIRRGR